MNCDIIIKSPSGYFFPKGSVEGIIIWNLEQNVEIKGIELQLRGEEHTKWTVYESYFEDVSNSTKYKRIQYCGNNKFLEDTINVAKEGLYKTGILEYPFNFILPKCCPSTYRTTHGSIRYYIKLIVQQLDAPNNEKEVEIFVVAPTNFNMYPGLIMTPVQYQDENILSCCYCTQGSVTINLYLDKEAYILGETMRFKVHVFNTTNENVVSVTARLKMVIKEIAMVPTSDSKHTEKLLANLRDVGVKSFSDKIYYMALKIPFNTVLPNFSMSLLFQVWCFLEIEAMVTGCHKKSQITTKITLGHIPRAIGTDISSETVYIERNANKTNSPEHFPQAIGNKDLHLVENNIPGIHRSTVSHSQDVLVSSLEPQKPFVQGPSEKETLLSESVVPTDDLETARADSKPETTLSNPIDVDMEKTADPPIKQVHFNLDTR